MSEMKLTTLTTPDEPECEECETCVGRREFFRIGFGTAALAALAALVPKGAAAAPVRWTRARFTGGALRYPVPSDDGVTVDRDNEVILVRYQGLVAAFALSCPHQRSLLRWREDDGIFRCTKHHSEYSPTGVYEKGRATRNMDRLGISLDGSEVVVDPTTVYHSDDDPQGWASAAVKLS
jgi:Rieske Fe-S protein